MRHAVNGKVRVDDTDTYVFMAPVTDFESDSAVLESGRGSLLFESDSNTRWVSLAGL